MALNNTAAKGLIPYVYYKKPEQMVFVSRKANEISSGLEFNKRIKQRDVTCEISMQIRYKSGTICNGKVLDAIYKKIAIPSQYYNMSAGGSSGYVANKIVTAKE